MLTVALAERDGAGATHRAAQAAFFLVGDAGGEEFESDTRCIMNVICPIHLHRWRWKGMPSEFCAGYGQCDQNIAGTHCCAYLFA